MENLWTPWRYHYVSGNQPAGCVFCRLIEEEPSQDEDNLVLTRDSLTYTVLNRFPYTSGHLLVVLNRHVATLGEAEPTELDETIRVARRYEEILRKVYRPDGFNIGFNVGKCAGAGVAGHLHLHVVPRWAGDSNMVSVLSQTRIIPEQLSTTYSKLLPYLSNR